MTRMVAIANQKGGVGKTTTAINLAAALALSEKRVLLVELDPQGNAGSGLGFPGLKVPKGIYEVLIAGMPIAEVIVETEGARPPPRALRTTSRRRGDRAGGRGDGASSNSRTALEAVQDKYDFILIDAPPRSDS